MFCEITMLSDIKKYFLRFLACSMFITLISSIAYGLRTAILEHDPITISMKTKFDQEQNIKVYYTNKQKEIYSDNEMQSFHVNAGEFDSKFELKNLNNISYFKFLFDRNVGTVEISDIKISGETDYQLSDLNKIIHENTEHFEIKGNTLIFGTNSMNTSIRYSEPINVCSKSYVWGIPINVYTLSAMLIAIFLGFWWLLSVISLINKDIADSFKKETQF